MKFERVGNVLALERIPVYPVPEREYTAIGIRSFGKGIFHYDPKPGDRLGSLRFFEVRPGRLVISNIKGWEGAIALSSERDAGCVASNRFLSYTAKDDRIDIDWARWFFLSEPGLRLIQRASPGSADRNRTLAIERFEALEIPLLPIVDQKRLSSRLETYEELSHRLEAPLRSRSHAPHILPRLLDGLLHAQGYEEVDLGTITTFVGETVHSKEAEALGLDFVGLEHIEPHTGRLLGASNPGDANGPKKRFEKGDITYPRLRPYQNKVWFATQEGVTSSDQLILRPRDSGIGPALALSLRSQLVLDQAIAMTSNLQLPRVRQATLARLRVPVPRDPDEFLRRGRRMTDLVLNLNDKQRHQARLVSSLLPAALNEAFTSL